MQKSKSQFMLVERISGPDIKEILVNIDQINWVNITESVIRMSDDLYLHVTEKSLKEVQERLSRIDVDDVHAEPSMIQLR
jgi:hypothetical protein